MHGKPPFSITYTAAWDDAPSSLKDNVESAITELYGHVAASPYEFTNVVVGQVTEEQRIEKNRAGEYHGRLPAGTQIPLEPKAEWTQWGLTEADEPEERDHEAVRSSPYIRLQESGRTRFLAAHELAHDIFAVCIRPEILPDDPRDHAMSRLTFNEAFAYTAAYAISGEKLTRDDALNNYESIEGAAIWQELKDAVNTSHGRQEMDIIEDVKQLSPYQGDWETYLDTVYELFRIPPSLSEASLDASRLHEDTSMEENMLVDAPPVGSLPLLEHAARKQILLKLGYAGRTLDAGDTDLWGNPISISEQLQELYRKPYRTLIPVEEPDGELSPVPVCRHPVEEHLHESLVSWLTTQEAFREASSAVRTRDTDLIDAMQNLGDTADTLIAENTHSAVDHMIDQQLSAFKQVIPELRSGQDTTELFDMVWASLEDGEYRKKEYGDTPGVLAKYAYRGIDIPHELGKFQAYDWLDQQVSPANILANPQPYYRDVQQTLERFVRHSLGA